MSKIYHSKDLSWVPNVFKQKFKKHFDKNFPIYIKVHFGEPWNNAAFKPNDIEPIVRSLQDLGYETILIDTPVAYPSPRNNVKWYMQVTKDLGYDKISTCLISDNFVKVKTKNFTSKVCKELYESQNVLVLSHVKGHLCAGFWWAIKNLWMWGLMKDTKIAIHDWAKPVFALECKGCGRCSQACPAWAIKMVDGKAKIDLNKCRGCSICQLVCPYSCLKPKVALFDDLLAQWACSVINGFKNQLYINYLIKISKKCDCDRECGPILSQDLWVLFSENPVAIDMASVDLINKHNWRNLFKESNIKDPYLQIECAEKYCNFKKDYEICE